MKLIIFSLIIFLLLPFNLQALNLQDCNEQSIKGIYDVIVYSNSFINDPETFIILDVADDNTKILPYAPSFQFKVHEKLDEKQALKIVHEILRDSANVSSIKCTQIKDGANIVGYELKPIYFPWIYGIMEPLDTSYKKDNNTITVFIKLNPIVERQIYFQNGDSAGDQ